MRELSAQRTYTRSRTPIFIYLTVQFIYLTLSYIYLTVLSYVAIVIWTSLAVQALHITRFDNKPRDVVSPPTVGGGTTYEVRLPNKKIPRDVVSPPTVGGGTTYEVRLRNKKIPRDVVSPPTVGGGTTYEVSLRNKKIPRNVVSPPTVGGGTTYEVRFQNKKKTSWCGFPTDSRWWYHIRGSLTKQIKNSWWWSTSLTKKIALWFQICLLLNKNIAQS